MLSGEKYKNKLLFIDHNYTIKKVLNNSNDNTMVFFFSDNDVNLDKLKKLLNIKNDKTTIWNNNSQINNDYQLIEFK